MKTVYFRYFIYCTITLLLSVEIGLADTCPTPSYMTVAQINSKISYDSKNQLYIYNYTVKNDSSSLLPIKRLLMLMPDAPVASTAPPNWRGTFMDLPHMPFHFIWSTWDLGPNPTEGDSLRSYYAIKPGKSLDGFSVKSPRAPGIQPFYVEGDTDLPIVMPIPGGDDEPEPNCPGYLKGKRFDKLPVGITQGPSDPNVTSVAIRLRTDVGEHLHHAFNPDHPQGNIKVLVLSSRTFDAASIDLSFIQFGPGKAQPISAKLVPGQKDEDDEKEEWERFLFHGKENDKEKAKEKGADESKSRQNLQLVFDLKSVGIRCILDHAVFLSGKTKDGKRFMGGKAIETSDCNMKKRHPSLSTKKREKEDD